MLIDCISDLHGEFPNLPGGDLLLIAGDLTSNDSTKAWINFFDWLKEQKYTNIVFIAGNHDVACQNFITISERTSLKNLIENEYSHIHYLEDSGIEIDGLKIWGSPWTKYFHGMNEKCTAFVERSEDNLAEKWHLIPNDTDILITHSPPFGMLDRVHYCASVGSTSLNAKIKKMKNLKVHLYGRYSRKLWPMLSRL